MFKKLKAFSLIEILIALALVGILVAVLSPNLGKALPDKKKALFVKAFTQTEIAVSNMRNHSEMYVDILDTSGIASGEKGTYTKYGLCNTDKPMGRLGEEEPQHGDEKFAYFFAKELGGSSSNPIVTNDGLAYNVEFMNADSKKPEVVAAEITIQCLGSEKDASGKAKLEQIGGVIYVLNDGTVKCASEDEDDLCNVYMKDRFNFKQKTE